MHWQEGPILVTEILGFGTEIGAGQANTDHTDAPENHRYPIGENPGRKGAVAVGLDGGMSGVLTKAVPAVICGHSPRDPCSPYPT